MADTKRILIVDDDDDFRAAVLELLQAQGFEVVCARSGREALQRISEGRPDLVVLDVMMENDFAGYEVTQCLRFSEDPVTTRPVPILMVSSIELDPATRFSRAVEAPMIQPDVYLTKPLDIPRFLENVASLLGVAGGRTAARA
jgi:two-component system phosphate regulon response regulator PhoB